MKLIIYLKSANRVTHTHLVLRTTNDVIIRGFGTLNPISRDLVVSVHMPI